MQLHERTDLNTKTCLIVGGGSGSELASIQSGHQKIQFIDSNALDDRESQKTKNQRCSAVPRYPAIRSLWHTNQKFDVICFPFFLDLYNQERGKATILDRAKRLLKDSGRLVVTDFYHYEKTIELAPKTSIEDSHCLF